MLIDLHSHILPGIDDGAADLSQSLALLKQEEDCGVDTLVLTPHFKPQVQKPEEFLRDRQAAFLQMREAYDGNIKFVLGAEVLYSPYLASIERIREFCIEGTDYLLLELPYHAKFNGEFFHRVFRLRDEHGILPILAHVERYEAVRRDPSVLYEFREAGCLFQVNAASFGGGFFLKRFLRRLERDGNLDLVATDCHDPEHRPAALSKALSILETQYGADLARRVQGTAYMILRNQRW